jgi:NADH-quinone oxidoreductase subunit L
VTEATIRYLCYGIVLCPLIASIIAGLFGKSIGKRAVHWITIIGVTISFIIAICIAKYIFIDGLGPFDFNAYGWVKSGSFTFHVGFLVDHLSAAMLLLVTFVSTLVHIYSIGYMDGDPGETRFFCYMSLFTFAMLMLVLANNFLTLFFGWEGVGLVSYLLIGFWFTKPTAAFGSLKAFIVNRVGDMGMILGIAGILTYFGNLNYQDVFAHKDLLMNQYITIIPGLHWHAVTVICILLFIGAAGKSAQMPLHVWLPESMEGPTPISAMIHAATMVTAGVYMVTRFSPLFEMSQVSLTLVLVLGATTCLFCGLLGVFQHDIKRVIAYSTLSQLGYMMSGVGASAFSAGMFHLFTHGCFKALLFLAAGSVIVANHHNQDMRKMGKLWRHLPVTYVTFLIGALALSAIPPFAGFYSKDTIIAAVKASTIPGSTYAYICVLLGAFVTALYTFRAFFLTFHGKDNVPPEVKKDLKESPFVMTFPLVMLAIPSALLGYFLVTPLIYAHPSLLGKSVFVLPKYNVLAKLAPSFHGPFWMAIHSVVTLPFWFAIIGIATAWYFNIQNPALAEFLKRRLSWIYYIFMNKYGFDDFNQIVFVRGSQKMGQFFLNVFDMKVIDQFFVNGTGRLIVWLSAVTRKVQTGYVYQYAFAMVIGLFVLLGWKLL